MDLKTNALYYGDNLAILRKYVSDESVDLVYLDPPFNSNRDYSVIFKDESGRNFDAQQLAFNDTWHWGPHAEATYAYLTNTAKHEGRVPSQVSTIISALRAGIGQNQMMSYLVEMTIRLVELHRVLKSTGSLYLHCDPTASHYLKIILDNIFGAQNFRNEIIWERTTGRKGLRQFGRVHDTILFYSRGPSWTWNPPMTDQTAESARGHDLVTIAGVVYRMSDLSGGGQGPPRRFGDTEIEPPPGRHWAFDQEGIDRLLSEGRISFSKGGRPRLLNPITELSVRDIWTDIEPLNAAARERLGYPTQKPLALAERIIEASSNSGDLVLDPFCGCGTALVAAQKLGRQWIGIDITYLSIAVMKARLQDSFALTDIDVIGQPTEVEGARQLLAGGDLESKYQFQWWALNLVGAKPVGGVEKKGADKGIDGIITFTNAEGELETVLVSVKSGGVGRTMIQAFKGDLETHKAAIGLFVTLEEPTKPMLEEAAVAGVYSSELTGRDYQRVQILSIKDLLELGKKPDLPLFVMPAFQKAAKVKASSDEQQKLGFG
jgi:site-specific DNA-methyltransferase (adenine-specific)